MPRLSADRDCGSHLSQLLCVAGRRQDKPVSSLAGCGYLVSIWSHDPYCNEVDCQNDQKFKGYNCRFSGANLNDLRKISAKEQKFHENHQAKIRNASFTFLLKFVPQSLHGRLVAMEEAINSKHANSPSLILRAQSPHN